MYGLGKENDGGKKFLFNLELDIKEHPERGRELLKKAEHAIQELKKALRAGANEQEFDRLGILLHGYTALQKVLKKVVKT